ncbi:MAG: LptF/LptG family permease [Sphingobacteriales bacterium]|nr:LptF/LptG family permease [Sphingobacteriales bacterium]
MLKKLDRYILKKFFTTVFFIVAALTVIATVIDISEKTDDFVKTNLSAKEIFFKYYIGFIPHIAALIFPLFVFIGVIWFTSKMAVKSEIVAILSGGVSFNRFLKPYLIGGILLGALLWFGNRYVIPKANYVRTDFYVQYLDRLNPDPNRPSFSTLTDLHFRIDSFTYAGMRSYDTTIKTGTYFYLQKIKGNNVVYNLRADNISWDTAAKMWKLLNVVERNINGLKEDIQLSQDKKMMFAFYPAELKKDEYLKDKLTTPQLTSYIKREELKGAEGLNTIMVERYKRDSIPFAVIIFTLMGGIVASRKVRGGSGLHLAMGLALAVSFEVLNKFSTVFSTNGNLPPLLAAWAPDILFAGICLWLYWRALK